MTVDTTSLCIASMSYGLIIDIKDNVPWAQAKNKKNQID